jgi:hypothetical protein
MAGAPSFLWRSRHGIYYFRFIVPETLRPILDGRREIRRSLGSSRRSEAVRRARLLAVRVETLFEELQGPHGHLSSPEAVNARLSQLLDLNVTEAMTAPTHGDEPRHSKATRANEPPETARSDNATLGADHHATVSEVVETYCSECVQAGSWTAKTEAENRAIP